MDPTKVWKGDRKRDSPSYNFKYQPFGLSKSNLEKLSLIGYEKVVDRILKQGWEHQLTRKEDFIIFESQFERNCQQQNPLEIVCQSCSHLGHYSKYCEVN